MTDATVRLWGRDVGAVSWDGDRQVGVFQYMPDFAARGIELAPLAMPLSPDPYAFPAHAGDSFSSGPRR